MTRVHPPPKRYDGKVAVVTGASSGIGRGLALTLADRGASVIGLARRRSLLDELATLLAQRSPGSATHECDVGDADGFRETLARLEEERGGIDILVNNAGVDLMLEVPGGDLDTVRQVFDVNFFATVAGTLAVLPGMAERGSGIVVNVSSDAARAPEPGQGAYAASKAALSAFSESVAHEMAHRGVSVHVLYPGWVPTAMGLPGAGDGGSLPPKMVRRTVDQVATLVADRMGGPRIDINAARLPLLAPMARTLAPVTYQKAMRRFATTG
ncbi:MAG: SDR family NAD(P)-dependent oxidoreductase [Acidimicrobiales bacterium]